MGTKAYTFDFVGFIDQHDEQIFGKKKTVLGKSYTSSYKKQINALNIKMNEVIDAYGTEDKNFLLGLFGMAINQFGTGVKSDVSMYKDDFYAFIEG